MSASSPKMEQRGDVKIIMLSGGKARRKMTAGIHRASILSSPALADTTQQHEVHVPGVTQVGTELQRLLKNMFICHVHLQGSDLWFQFADSGSQAGTEDARYLPLRLQIIGLIMFQHRNQGGSKRQV